MKEAEKVAEQAGADLQKIREIQAKPVVAAKFLALARPRIMPPPWGLLRPFEDGGAYTDGTLTVITSAAREEDNRVWLHVSVSRRDMKLPTYEDLCRVKILFVGSNRTAIQVFPRKAEHVNIHPACLHLWCCLEGDVLPDFTGGTKSI